MGGKLHLTVACAEFGLKLFDIGVVDTAHGNAISEYLIRASLPGNLTPHKMAFDAQGNLWWTEGWVRAVGMLNRSLATPGQCGAASGNCAIR